MTNVRTFQRSFAGGILSPEMFGRFDDPRHQNGAETLDNFICVPAGAARRRPGTKFVRAAKYTDKRFRMLPFRFSATESIAVEMGEGYFRFHQNGGTILQGSPATFKDPQNLASIGGSGQFVLSSPHGFTTGDAVYLAWNTTGALPTPIAVLTRYYIIQRASASEFDLATTEAKALRGEKITLTTTTLTNARVYPALQPGVIRAYLGNNYVLKMIGAEGIHEIPADGTTSTPAITWSTDTVNLTSHGFATGQAVVFTSANDAMPNGLSEGTVYYVSNTGLGANSFRISATFAGAATGTAGALSFTTAGTSGTYTVQQAPLWHRQPATGEYEIPNDYLESELFDVTYDGSFDITTLSHLAHPASELRRYGATQWSFGPLGLGAAIATPVIGSSQLTYGLNVKMVSVVATAPCEFSTTVTGSKHGLGLNETVYVELAPVGSQTAFAGNPAGFYSIDTRVSDTRVTLRKADGADAVAAIGSATNVVMRPSSLSADLTNQYVVTAVDSEDVETEVSNVATLLNNLSTPGASNKVLWSPVTGAQRYRVYKRQAGQFGFVGEVSALDLNSPTDYAFLDENIGPDNGRTPPIRDTTLQTAYPAAVAHFEQRRYFGGGTANPRLILGTRSGTETDFSYHLPVQDDDRIRFQLASRVAEVIRHIVPLQQLVVLTSDAEYRITPVNSDALTPTSVSARAQSYVGSSTVRPVVVNNSLVFCAARGGRVREMGYSSEVGGFLTGDLSIRCSSLFDGYTIADADLAKAPTPIVWFTSSSGALLGMTYVPEEQLGAWHRHTTQGSFESICTLTENDEDVPYVAVKRTLPGAGVVRYVEQMQPVRYATAADAFFVDSGLTYTNGTAGTVSTITGLSHLEGMTVQVIQNGVVQATKVVASGQITLSTPLPVGQKVVIGLGYTSLLRTLPLAAQIDAAAQGRVKNINHVWPRVQDAGAYEIGPSLSQMVPAPAATNDESRVFLSPAWTQSGQVYIRQSNPLPLTVLCVTTEVALGGG